MKKRIERIGLSVILVLALVSVSNATLTWTLVDENGGANVELGDYVLITVTSDVKATWDYGVYITTPTVAVLQGATMLSDAGNSSSVTSYGSYVGHDYHAEGPAGLKAGDWSTVQFLSNTADTYTVNLYDYTTYGGSYSSPPTSGFVTADLTVVPEPATIALLGLGGMFLMRRRRRG